MIVLSFLVVCLCLKYGVSQDIGERCNNNGVPGVCMTLSRCSSILDDPRKRWTAMRCGFAGNEPILCCSDKELLDNRVVATRSPIRTTTTEYTPTLAVYEDLVEESSSCAPIPAKHTAQKTGKKAFDKCIEYQERLVYPCERGADLTGRLSRGNNCFHNADDLIVGGKDAKRDEFPHMALLGYSEGSVEARMICGGIVISENFILTAGHCTYARGAVQTATVGILRLSEHASGRVYRIKRIIKHPQYKPPSKYHDIALLETEIPMTLDKSVVPACLDIGDGVDDSKAIATGWGHNESFGDVTDILQKVTLQKFSPQECTPAFRDVRNLERGYDDRTQICYGDHLQSKDACQGDSGGPLQKHSRVHCMYTVVGVTSFGKYCGVRKRPGMYTRVSSYTSWIESHVWP